MKQLLLVLSSSWLLTSVAHAQLGVRAGGNLSRLRYSGPQQIDYPAFSTSSRLGYQVGVFYEVPLTAHFSVVPEVQFCRQSMDESVQNYGYRFDSFTGLYRLTRSQLVVPVMVKFKVGVFYAEAGPQATYLVGGRQAGTEEFYYGFATLRQQADRPTSERFRRFDVGPCVGVGLSLPAGIGINVRGYWGLRQAGEEADTYTPFPATYVGPVNQQMLQASLTYQLAAR
jgi:outer membrane immunogenic protein